MWDLAHHGEVDWAFVSCFPRADVVDLVFGTTWTIYHTQTKNNLWPLQVSLEVLSVAMEERAWVLDEY